MATHPGTFKDLKVN